MALKRRKPDAKAESPLEAKLRAVAAEEAKNRAAMEECQQVIDDAPQRAKKKAEAQRAQLLDRAARTETRRDNPAALPDRWRPMAVHVRPDQPRHLRAERRQGRRLFFVLLFALLGVGYWLYYTVTHS